VTWKISENRMKTQYSKCMRSRSFRWLHTRHRSTQYNKASKMQKKDQMNLKTRML